MASYIKMDGKWRVTVCVHGRRKTRTFKTKNEASAWAADTETQLRDIQTGNIPDLALSQLLELYEREVVPTKKGAKREKNMVRVMLRDRLARVSLRALNAEHIAEWRDRRLGQVSASSVNREMNTLSHALSVARREWRWLKTNPVSDVRRPRQPPPRSRRPQLDEIEAILYQLHYTPHQPPTSARARVGWAFLFSIETAMRQGEICDLRWDDVDPDRRYLH